MEFGLVFGDNWRRIKASKLWNPHDISDALIQKVMRSGNQSAISELYGQAYILGMEDGNRMLSRAGHEKTRIVLAESFLLMCGVPFEQSSPDVHTCRIRIWFDPGSSRVSIFAEPGVRIAYMKGYLSALLPEGTFDDTEEGFFYTFRVPPDEI